MTYLAAMVGTVIYLATTFLANSLIYTTPQTVTVPSPQAAKLARDALVIGVVWGAGAPYLIALVTVMLRRKTP